MSIEKITSEDGLSQSKNLIQENIEQLKKLFPEIVTEDKIDFKSLQQILGEEIEDEEEYYRFTWSGKSQARREAHKPSTGTLRPCKEESLDWDTTQNLYIEGDNLEVLKLLQKSYSGKIKMIYIDPPYNTGKDFVYKDNYKDNLKNYQEITGQVDSDGNKLSTNTDSDGRFHSNWLNMMYPRLRLSRNLLKDDGVIFISIDDNEVDNLTKLMNELYGENNFIGRMIIDGTPKNDPYVLSTSHEYCLVYVKNLTSAKNGNYGVSNPIFNDILEIYNRYRPNYDLVNQELVSFYHSSNRTNDNISNYKYSDENGVYRLGPIDDPQNSGPKDERINPLTGNPCKVPSSGWRCTIDTWDYWKKNNLILFPESDDRIPNKKTYISKDRLDVLKSYFKIQTRKDTQYLKDLFGTEITPFSNPKPRKFLKEIIKNCNDKEGIYLDFFSGSASFGQSILECNAEDNGDRKFILVQLPEQIELNGSNKEKKISNAAIEYLKSRRLNNTICELAKERLRLCIDKEFKVDIFRNFDLGFKVIKLDSSNIKSWDGNPENLESSLFDSVSNIKSDRTEEDVLYEILLKYGLEFTLPIEERNIQGKKVFNVGMGSLFICLSDDITSKVAEGIGEWKEECDPEVCRVIFKDNGFTDVEKTNSVQILKRFGINEVRSI